MHLNVMHLNVMYLNVMYWRQILRRGREGA